ncbi:hypothetical protein [Novosphingobium album (ex Hu et al. 2023)]|uniref:Tyrosine kinase G-rich domain-containing protein n=1 Tax=Novosphingobium album (ex Hu et al. 2023) TaxID=2930093 RepID=A0ABT0B4S5_9SPHN|nr:hypothetical protein [Novosphingobium album (ex Hu et al. 2023)]MCJ2180040.1 hypothetical protein [Novosphingobium album (ex Hu et al. 2023)]
MALAVAYRLPKTYEGKARVHADFASPDPATGKGVPMSRAVASHFADTQTAIIEDPIVSEPVALKLGYVISPPAGNTNDPAYLRSLRSSARAIADQTVVEWDGTGMYFNILFYAETPEDARKGADAVREVYLARMLEMRRQKDLLRLDALQEENARLVAALDRAAQRKRDFEKANGIHLFDDETDAIENTLRALSGNQRALRTDTPARPAIDQGNFAQIARIDAALSAAQMQLGPNHPTVLALRSQRAALAAQTATAVASGATPQYLDSAGALTAQTTRLLEERGKLQAARLIANEVSVLSQQATTLASETSELKRKIASNHIGLKPIGPAKAPAKPVRPKIPLIGGIALALGLVLGVQISVVFELLNRRVRGTDDLADLGVPILVAYNHKKVDQPEAPVSLVA